MKTLTRNHAGFVQYPSDLPPRTLDGSARFRTKCDMLVGPCSCGDIHQEWDIHTKRLCRTEGTKIETMTLIASEDGSVHIPRYWLHINNDHYNCDVFSGECACGQTHTANELWIKETLDDHFAKIIFFPEADLPTVESRVGTTRSNRYSFGSSWADRKHRAAENRGVYQCH